MDALVGTRATYLEVPRSVLDLLGIRVSRQRRFKLADEREVHYDVGHTMLRVNDDTNPVLTVFGDIGTQALLGAVPLETFGLAIDPVNQRLIDVHGLLMSYST